MSALLRFANRAVVQRSLAYNQSLSIVRGIKTSPKKDETAASVAPVTKEDFANPNPKNWVSFGFDTKDETNDRNSTKSSFFFAVTLCLAWGTFFWAYLPDTQLRDWAQREAYLELRRREKAGVDLVSPNYVDPASISLPSDDELGDTEIII
ncbi:NADH dehydrogenase [ubiquinone] 1 beta subcomplex subunit 11, mitochondrial [Lucilia sericata]|uniref:NADH dehydrogenase [ubiquinone] 1 beta subcomplex subunit 11, mitochondrial n=1 Tax=Lucilia sericata TaxID=13632 RepID=UPI0018A841EB|nr:NADH dehydrogenase [ubiquinone] 1 beta subcomplex subunit 11, mitochondrial [Lucilia sericata]XP_037806323.1 NADH dehydrogenase [ubiquinone] 1 beta subcomplex subunit 11, mitochondrial [Lucilia sericata]